MYILSDLAEQPMDMHCLVASIDTKQGSPVLHEHACATK